MENRTKDNRTECNVLLCPYLFNKEVYIAMLTLFMLIIASGIFLNSVVCFVYFKGYVKQSACNLMLTCLSVSDIGSDIFTLPYLFLDHTYLDVDAQTGKVICGLMQAGFITCIAVSIMTLAFISVTRLLLINYPFRCYWIHSTKAVKVFIFAAWTIAIGGLTPLFISFRHEKHTNICYREWSPHVNGEVYSAAMGILGFVIPIFIMITTFCWSSRTLALTPASVRDQSVAFKERRRIMILLGSLIFVFILFWGPYFVYWTLSRVITIFPATVDGEYTRKRLVRVMILIALCNTVADPLVYVVTAKEFRKGFRTVFCSHGNRIRLGTQSHSRSTSPPILRHATEPGNGVLIKRKSTMIEELHHQVTNL